MSCRLSTAQKGGGARARNAVEDLNGGNRPPWRMGGNRLSHRRYSCALSRAVGLGRGPSQAERARLAGEHQKEVFWKVDEAKPVACRRAAVRRCWCVGASNEKGAQTKKGGRYVEPWVLLQEGRERQFACLDRGNSAGPAVTGLGVSISKIC